MKWRSLCNLQRERHLFVVDMLQRNDSCFFKGRCINYSSCCPLISRWKVREKNSAAFRHSTMRWRKISK